MQLPTADFDFSTIHMARALELAERGQGSVEPNPMVGCVIVDPYGEVIGEGYHQRFGGPHAEIEALKIAGSRARGAALFVTLEPCCHHGKTPPCTAAIQAAGITRVVAAMRDPFPKVDGGGFTALQQAGIDVSWGLLEDEARSLNAPYLKRLTQNRPWIIAKWAMTLDGKIATSSGDSKWISNEASRALVHQLRGRVDAIVVGSKTALADDPLLTARPTGLRVATRIVVGRTQDLTRECQLLRTAAEYPTLFAIPEPNPAEEKRITAAGAEVFVQTGPDSSTRLVSLLDELGRRSMTNVLVEGGGTLLGSLFDLGAVDEAHVFIAPKLVGGAAAPSPIAGIGVSKIQDAWKILEPKFELLGDVVYTHGRVSSARGKP